MKILYVSLLFFNLTFAILAQSALSRLLHNPLLKHASVGVCVHDLSSAKTIVSHNAEKALTPASTLKLITTATALELMDADYRYKTIVALDPGQTNRILVLGGGDPSLGSKVFDPNPTQFLSDWASKATSRCATKNVWHVYVADDLFGYAGISREWTWEDMGNYYAAGTYGISIFDNTYRLYFDTTDRNACPKILRTEPEIKELIFTNYLTTNTSGHDNGYIYGMPFSNERDIRGSIPAGRKNFSIKGDIPNPGMLLAKTFTEYLKQEGVNVQSARTSREDYISGICDNSPPLYQKGEVLHTHFSPPMSKIIREVNVKSNNHYAEHLIRTIGRNQNCDIYSDALEEGVAYIHRFWKSKNIDTEPLSMQDGCGLAPKNSVSPHFLTDLLTYMHKRSNHSDTFFASLPKAGEEGTLRYFLNGTRYQGKIRAKSGSIGGVQCYAGYLLDGKKKYAFAIMINKFTGSRKRVQKAIEEFLLSL